MNQDFALLATPANARRLLAISRVNATIIVPSDLVALATHDCITEAEFDPFVCPYTPERAHVTQFLLDSDLRAIVQAAFHPVMDELTILNAVRLAHPNTVTIVGSRRNAWRTAAAAYALPDVHYASPYDLRGAEIDARRDGVLIIDLEGQNLPNPALHYAREFPRTILYESIETKLNRLNHWTTLATLLFPTMPHPWAIRAVKNNPKQWAIMRLIDFVLYYNVCFFADYITSEEVLAIAENWQHSADNTKYSVGQSSPSLF